MCRGPLFQGEHLWNSAIGVPSKVIECDWCVICSAPRPGFIDPAARAAQWKAEADAAEEETLQGLPGGQQTAGSVPGPPLRDVQPGGEEAA